MKPLICQTISPGSAMFDRELSVKIPIAIALRDGQTIRKIP